MHSYQQSTREIQVHIKGRTKTEAKCQNFQKTQKASEAQRK